MARVNVGIDPKFLSDQHLIAESVEITMITGNLRKNKYVVKSEIPDKYCLGPGHMNFFKDKILYLHYRLIEVNNELSRRNIKNSTSISISEFPKELVWSWTPTIGDSDIVRNRIRERLVTPLKAKSGFHRYEGKPIDNMEEFANRMIVSKLFWV